MKTSEDWVSQPLHCLLWWVTPIAAAMFVDGLTSGSRWAMLAWSLALAWMGAGCLLNARRCHRRHCYLAGPILLIGAAILGLKVAGIAASGPISGQAVLWGTFGLVLLSFVPELLWGKYLRPRGPANAATDREDP